MTVDFLIYNITKIREAEKLESKLKSKFLGKIAHEFKTPINSILGLIKKILYNLDNNEENDISELPKDIKQVENLCSYTLFLIDDIIEYSFKSNFSNSIFYSNDELEEKCGSSRKTKTKSETGNFDHLCKKFFRKKNKLNIKNDIKNDFASNKAKDLEKLDNNTNITFTSFHRKLKINFDQNSQINNEKFFKKFNNEDLETSLLIYENYSMKKNEYLYSKSENLAYENPNKILDNLSSSNNELGKEKKIKMKNLKSSKNHLIIKNNELSLSEITSFCKGVAETLLLSKGKESSIKILYNYDDVIDNYKIISDEFRIKQILLNFLSNSVKFTKCGYILIKSVLIDNNSKIKLSVIDTGLGIKENEIKFLFKDKFMSETTKMLNQAGSGLGLSISKSIVDKLGFTIEVKSEFGK